MSQSRNGLACTVRPEEGEHFARANLQADAGHRLDPVVGLAQPVDLDHDRTGHLSGLLRSPGGGIAVGRFHDPGGPPGRPGGRVSARPPHAGACSTPALPAALASAG